MPVRSVKILSDKHRDHEFKVIKAGKDNDFTVAISGTDLVTGQFVSLSVVIASPGLGGGRNRATYQAMPGLMAAMEKDNPTQSS